MGMRFKRGGRYQPEKLSKEQAEAEIAAMEDQQSRSQAHQEAYERGRPVSAYEDNGGGVYVAAEDDEEAYEAAYTERGERFSDMARMVDRDDTTNFTTGRAPAEDIRQGRRLATYHKGQIERHVEPEELPKSLRRWLGFE